MKLLIITQKVDINDDLLGIYHEWVKRIAVKCESVTVVCLYKGEYDLPENVEVFSLGKEQYFNSPRFFRRLTAVFRFYKYVWKLRKEYDTVFIHMNPEYLILAGWLWKLMGKKTVLWYAHYLDNFKLRLTTPFADKIVTSAKRAFPYEIKKLTVLQQGIDTDKFSPSKKIIKKEESGKLKIISLGRISPVKDLETLIEAANILKNSNFNFSLDIWGEPTDKDTDYFEKIKNLITNLGLSDKISLLGKISTNQNPEVYLGYDIFVNLTRTGSFDKTILEAMSSGLPVLVANEIYKEIFEAPVKENLIFKARDAQDLADKIIKLVSLPQSDLDVIKIKMREIILSQHGLDGLVDKLKNALEI